MEPNQKTSAKDFFLNLGAIVALYTVVITLVNLLFTVINRAWPQVNSGYYYGSYSGTISWPVATLIIFFPVYILLMWLLERDYVKDPQKRNLPIRRWLTYITLFIAGLTMAIDLVTVIYYFIDGQELTTGFLMKVFSLFVLTLLVFFYYIQDIREKLNSASRKVWTIVALVIVVGGITWGFSVIGSPRTQQLLRYDEQKVNDLQNINSYVQSYYSMKGSLPQNLSELAAGTGYQSIPNDPQTGNPYEYKLIGQSSKAYELCANFNSQSPEASQPNIYMRPVGYQSWNHPAGHYCFSESIPVNMYPAPKPL